MRPALFRLIAKAPFDSLVFLKYSKNTAVFWITMVLITTRCLAAIKNNGFKTAVLGRLWFFLCIKKRTPYLFLKSRAAEKKVLPLLSSSPMC